MSQYFAENRKKPSLEGVNAIWRAIEELWTQLG